MKHKIYLRLPELTIMVNDCHLTPIEPVLAEAEFVYEPAIKATEDEPGCAEYIDLISLRAVANAYFEDATKKVFLVLYHNCELMDVLFFKDWDYVYEEILKMKHWKDGI